MSPSRWLLVLLSFVATVGASAFVVWSTWPAEGGTVGLPLLAHVLGGGAFLLELLSRAWKIQLSARALRVPLDRLLANARALEMLGYVKSGPADQMTIEEGFIFLTTPRGVTWANDGAPPIGPDGRPSAVAPARIAPHQLLDQAERSALSERHKERFQTLLTRLERDKQQGRDMVDTVKELLDVAKNGEELLPAVLRFAAEQIEDVQRATQQRPGS